LIYFFYIQKDFTKKLSSQNTKLPQQPQELHKDDQNRLVTLLVVLNQLSNRRKVELLKVIVHYLQKELKISNTPKALSK
jgi:hypothetical protein